MKKMWCIEKIICIFNNILKKSSIQKILSMKKCKWPKTKIVVLESLLWLAHLIVITPFENRNHQGLELGSWSRLCLEQQLEFLRKKILKEKKKEIEG